MAVDRNVVGVESSSLSDWKGLEAADVPGE